MQAAAAEGQVSRNLIIVADLQSSLLEKNQTSIMLLYTNHVYCFLLNPNWEGKKWD